MKTFVKPMVSALERSNDINLHIKSAVFTILTSAARLAIRRNRRRLAFSVCLA